MKFTAIIAVFLFVVCRPAQAGEFTMAVASNFLPVAEELTNQFQSKTGHDVRIVHGSTGQLYAQIISGAPFDIYLSADQRRPAELQSNGLSHELATYAIGRLVLVSRTPIDIKSAQEAFDGQRVALADPMVAPYGLASTSAMESLGVDTATFRPLLVSNVAQAASLFLTRNANLAFVSASLVEKIDPQFVSSMDGLHAPIRQDGVLLSRSKNNEAAIEFWTFLQSDIARDTIAENGFNLPE